MVETVKLLLVEDNPGDARYLKEILKDVRQVNFEIDQAERMTKTIVYLEQGKYDVILLDLGLPDSHGFETFEQVHNHSPGTPIVILSGNKDSRLAARAVESGAQDFQIKGEIEEKALVRSIRYAIKRQIIRDKMDLTNKSNARKTTSSQAVGLQASASLQPTEVDYSKALKERDVRNFTQLTKKYRELLTNAFTRPKCDARSDLSRVLQLFAKELGYLKSSSDDFLEIHASSLSSITQQNSDTNRVSQLMFLEVLGYLSSHYYYQLFDSSIVSGKLMEMQIEY